MMFNTSKLKSLLKKAFPPHIFSSSALEGRLVVQLLSLKSLLKRHSRAVSLMIFLFLFLSILHILSPTFKYPDYLFLSLSPFSTPLPSSTREWTMLFNSPSKSWLGIPVSRYPTFSSLHVPSPHLPHSITKEGYRVPISPKL